MLTQSTGLHPPESGPVIRRRIIVEGMQGLKWAGRMIDLSAYRGSAKAAGALQRLQEIESMGSPHN